MNKVAKLATFYQIWQNWQDMAGNLTFKITKAETHALHQINVVKFGEISATFGKKIGFQNLEEFPKNSEMELRYMIQSSRV